MVSVALTGSVASGKSTVARVWQEDGVPVVSADALAREAVRPGSPALDAIRSAFGGEVLTPEGTLDRARMRDRVFRDDEARRRLESIVHPRVHTLREAWLAAREAEGRELVVSEIPLLFEVGAEADFDAVVCVDAALEARLGRMVEDRDLEVDEARRIAAAQMDPELKRAGSDHVLVNDGTVDALRTEARDLLDVLRDPPRTRIDMHLHTRASWDCLSDPAEVLRTAVERGLGRIAVTDHDTFEVARSMAARHPGRIIPGEEVRTAEGVDVIGLHLTETIPRGTPAREVVERVHAQGGVSYLPHPFAPGKGGGGRLAEELAPLVHVVETFNSRLHPASRNDPAGALAERHRTLRGAGSDAHTLREVGRAWVEVPRHPNQSAALRRALRRARVHGVESSRLVHLASTWAKLRKKLPGRPNANPGRTNP